MRVRALHGALSRGTEALVLAGRVPESEFERMRAPFMGGVFRFRSNTAMPRSAGWRRGRTIWPAASSLRCIRIRPCSIFRPEPSCRCPKAYRPLARSLAANMETAVNAVWDAAPEPGARIAIVGAGVVGALVAFALRRLAPRHEVTLVDINPSRAKLAQAFGVHFAAPDAAPSDCDLVVHASATAAGLATALNLAADEATVLELSWYGAGTVPVPLGGAFHSRRLRLVSSQVGKIAPSHREKYTHRSRLEFALKLIAEPELEVLMEPAVAFDDLPARLAKYSRTYERHSVPTY